MRGPEFGWARRTVTTGLRGVGAQNSIYHGRRIRCPGDDEANVFGTLRGHLDFLSRCTSSQGALLPGMHHRVDRHGDRQDHSIILIGLDLHTV